MFLRVASETPRQRRRRLKAQQATIQERTAKLERTRHGGAHDDVALANSFREIGINYLNLPREQAFKIVPERLEGKRVSSFSAKALDFLIENFNVERVDDSEGRSLLHFKPQQQGEEPMNLFSVLSEASGQPRKICREVYEGLVTTVQKELKENRRIRLPGLAIVRVKYSPAKPKRKGINPFTGEKAIFKAKSETNKIRVTPVKDLKVFAAKKIPVVAPRKKKK
jgi:DNA-binding protein HU-beta